MKVAIVASPGALHALDVVGTTTSSAAVERGRRMDEARQNLTSFISFSAYLRYQARAPIGRPWRPTSGTAVAAPMIGKRPG